MLGNLPRPVKFGEEHFRRETVSRAARTAQSRAWSFVSRLTGRAKNYLRLKPEVAVSRRKCSSADFSAALLDSLLDRRRAGRVSFGTREGVEAHPFW